MYTKEQTRKILQEAAFLVMEDEGYRLNYVPPVDDTNPDVIWAMNKDTMYEVSLDLNDIDLSAPGVQVYKLVQVEL